MDDSTRNLIRKIDGAFFVQGDTGMPQDMPNSANPLADYFRSKASAHGKNMGIDAARAGLASVGARELVKRAPAGPMGILSLLAGLGIGGYGYFKGRDAVSDLGGWADNTNAAEMWDGVGENFKKK